MKGGYSENGRFVAIFTIFWLFFTIFAELTLDFVGTVRSPKHEIDRI